MSMSIQPAGLGKTNPTIPVDSSNSSNGDDATKQLLQKVKGQIEQIFQMISKLIGEAQGGGAAGKGANAPGPDAAQGGGGQGDSGGGSGGGCSGAGGGDGKSGGGAPPSAGGKGSEPPGAGGGKSGKPGDAAPPTNGSGSAALVAEINRVRAENGLKPVTEATNLDRASAENDAAQQTKGIGHHVDLGKNGASGEIAFMASNGANPQNSVQGWLGSPEHKKILLDPNMTKVGADMNGQFSTADFS